MHNYIYRVLSVVLELLFLEGFFSIIYFFIFPDHYQVLPLRFSEHLDLYNPNIPAWREDVGHVVTQRIAQVLCLVMDNSSDCKLANLK